MVSWPTPKGRVDVVFYVERNGDLPENTQWTYGDTFRDKTKYPNHKLVYVTEQTPDAWSKWYYAADREDQDDYNWELDGNQLVRTYIIPRANYRQKADGAADLLPNEFTYPPAATADDTFASYGFADDTVSPAARELEFVYVTIRRRFIEPVTEEVKWLEEYQKFVRIRRELVAAAVSPAVPAVPANGVKIEYQHGGIFHDVKITYTLETGGATSWLATTGGAMIDHAFPVRLLSPVTIPYAYAWADSTEAAPSYSEDFYFDFTLVDPRPGPYEATVYTYFVLPANLAALLSANPVTLIPVPQRETVAMIYWWWYASVKGNSSQAYAKQIEIPASVHDAVAINPDDIGTGTPGGTLDHLPSTNLVATPGFAAFKALSVATLNVKYELTEFGLYKVVVTKLNVSGIYS